MSILFPVVEDGTLPFILLSLYHCWRYLWSLLPLYNNLQLLVFTFRTLIPKTLLVSCCVLWGVSSRLSCISLPSYTIYFLGRRWLCWFSLVSLFIPAFIFIIIKHFTWAQSLPVLLQTWPIVQPFLCLRSCSAFLVVGAAQESVLTQLAWAGATLRTIIRATVRAIIRAMVGACWGSLSKSFCGNESKIFPTPEMSHYPLIKLL